MSSIQRWWRKLLFGVGESCIRLGQYLVTMARRPPSQAWRPWRGSPQTPIFVGTIEDEPAIVWWQSRNGSVDNGVWLVHFYTGPRRRISRISDPATIASLRKA